MSTLTTDDIKEIIAGAKTSMEQLLALELLAAREAQSVPIGSFHITDQQVEATTDYVKDGEWPIDNGELLVYAAPPALQADIEVVVNLLESGEWAEHCTKTEFGQRLEVAVTNLIGRQSAPALPDNPPEDILPKGNSVSACIKRGGVIAGWQAYHQAAMKSRTYTDDKEQENGNYQCACINCGNVFSGHKRRVICRQCNPQPAVPDEMPRYENQEYGSEDDCYRAGKVDGWNACRAAMLQPVSQGYTLNSPVIPDGWKLVPAEPTPKQWAAGIKAMDGGIDKVTLAYRAMVAAAPTPTKAVNNGHD